MFFGDWVTSQTILKVLGEEYDYFPSYNNQIVFELYDRDTQPYVYASYNGQPMSLMGIAEEGNIMFNQFQDLICDLIYYGDIDKVKEGEEDWGSDAYQKAENPICVELLYNRAFKNNEYIFEDLEGVKVEHVMNYDRPYLA